MPKSASIIALVCMVAAGGASAQVFKSVGSDGKVSYSDHPSDKVSASVRVIKADIVQPAVAAAPRADSNPRAAALAALSKGVPLDAASKDVLRAAAADKRVCDKMVTVVVDADGQIIKSLGPTNLLAAVKTH
jgi:hypothetical protein